MKGSFEKNGAVPKVGQKIWYSNGGLPPYFMEDTVTVVYGSDSISTGSIDTKNGWHKPLNMVFDHRPTAVSRTDEYGTFEEWE